MLTYENPECYNNVGLLYVLLQHHLPYKLFNIIYSMYHETKCRIKFQNGISHDFTSTFRVKQGDVLSPTLFNLYIDNLVNDLKIGHTHPLVVGDVTVTSLLYADDILLVSESEEGLQNGLNVLSKCCSSWKLEVNTKTIQNNDI